MRTSYIFALQVLLSAMGGPSFAADGKAATGDPFSGLTLDAINEARAKLDAKPELKLLNACPFDANACTRYGVALMNGTPTLPKNPVEARKFLSSGCTKGDPAGCRALGMAHQGGLGGPVDLVSARSSYTKACDRRDAQSCARLGDMVALGKGGPADAVQGKVYLNKACDYGAAKICSQLGRIVGSQVIVSKPAAKPARTAPVTINTGKALTADQIMNGDYSKTGPEQAFRIECVDKAASCTKYGLALMNGTPTLAKDPAQSMRYLGKACDRNEAIGCRGMAYSHEKGLAGKVDLPAARKAYAKACDHNDGVGCAKAGQFTLYAMGGAVDLTAALGYFRKGCDFSNALSCGALGQTLSSGEFMKPDYPKALIISKKACELGEEAGCSDVRAIRNKMAEAKPAG